LGRLASTYLMNSMRMTCASGEGGCNEFALMILVVLRHTCSQPAALSCNRIHHVRHASAECMRIELEVPWVDALLAAAALTRPCHTGELLKS
jgi:hypothetical protein